MKTPARARAQPAPSNPGITKQMVRQHARRLFRDKWAQQPLTTRESVHPEVVGAPQERGLQPASAVEYE